MANESSFDCSQPRWEATGEKTVTQLLRRIADGDRGARNQLFELLYSELRQLATSQLRGQPADHTLQTTALVHEAAAKLLDGNGLRSLRDRKAFYAVASRTMRSILVDHARKRSARKRPTGDGRHRVELDDVIDDIERTEHIDLLALDDALQELATHHERCHEIVTLHFFGGLEFREIAKHVSVSLSTVEKDWKFSRCWLLRRMNPDDDI